MMIIDLHVIDEFSYVIDKFQTWSSLCYKNDWDKLISMSV